MLKKIEPEDMHDPKADTARELECHLQDHDYNITSH